MIIIIAWKKILIQILVWFEETKKEKLEKVPHQFSLITIIFQESYCEENMDGEMKWMNEKTFSFWNYKWYQMISMVRLDPRGKLLGKQNYWTKLMSKRNSVVFPDQFSLCSIYLWQTNKIISTKRETITLSLFFIFQFHSSKQFYTHKSSKVLIYFLFFWSLFPIQGEKRKGNKIFFSSFYLSIY